MITINNDLENSIIAYLYCPIGHFIGQIKNYAALLDARRQIKESGKTGYHIAYTVYEGEEVIDSGDVQISSKGKLLYRPPYFFDQVDNLLIKLI